MFTGNATSSRMPSAGADSSGKDRNDRFRKRTAHSAYEAAFCAIVTSVTTKSAEDALHSQRDPDQSARTMRKKKLLVLIIMMGFIGVPGPSAAGPFEDALTAHQKGDYETALRIWRPLAEQGDARAQFSIGNMYANGQGVPKDMSEAMRWYQKSNAPRTSTRPQEAPQGAALPQYGTEEYHRWFQSTVTVDVPAKKDSEQFLNELSMKRLTEIGRFQGYPSYKDGEFWVLDTRTGQVRRCTTLNGCFLMK